MPHRVQQVIAAAEAAHKANANLRANVEIHRVQSLSDLDDEIPMVCINYGADTPDAATDMRSYGSVIDIAVTAYCKGDSERKVLEQLLELRRQSHVAMMADMKFGLAFVWDTSYAGADTPVIQKLDRWVGALTSHWPVRYTMNLSDPG